MEFTDPFELEVLKIASEKAGMGDSSDLDFLTESCLAGEVTAFDSSL